MVKKGEINVEKKDSSGITLPEMLLQWLFSEVRYSLSHRRVRSHLFCSKFLFVKALILFFSGFSQKSTGDWRLQIIRKPSIGLIKDVNFCISPQSIY